MPLNFLNERHFERRLLKDYNMCVQIPTYREVLISMMTLPLQISPCRKVVMMNAFNMKDGILFYCYYVHAKIV